MARTKLETIYPFLVGIDKPRCMVFSGNGDFDVYSLNSEKEMKFAIASAYETIKNAGLFSEQAIAENGISEDIFNKANAGDVNAMVHMLLSKIIENQTEYSVVLMGLKMPPTDDQAPTETVAEIVTETPAPETSDIEDTVAEIVPEIVSEELVAAE